MSSGSSGSVGRVAQNRRKLDLNVRPQGEADGGWRLGDLIVEYCKNQTLLSFVTVRPFEGKKREG